MESLLSLTSSCASKQKVNSWHLSIHIINCKNESEIESTIVDLKFQILWNQKCKNKIYKKRLPVSPRENLVMTVLVMANPTRKGQFLFHFRLNKTGYRSNFNIFVLFKYSLSSSISCCLKITERKSRLTALFQNRIFAEYSVKYRTV